MNQCHNGTGSRSADHTEPCGFPIYKPVYISNWVNAATKSHEHLQQIRAVMMLVFGFASNKNYHVCV